MTLRSSHIRFALMALMTLAAQTAGAAEADSVASEQHTSWMRRGVVGKVVNYFESSNKTVITRRPSFSVLGGPHYSTDEGFGIGLVAAGIYSTQPEDTTLVPSNVSLFADITTGGFFKIGINGLHLYGRGSRRVDYELSFNSYKTYFWGVGYERARMASNKSKYLLLDMMLEADHLWKIGSTPLFIGPSAKLDYIAARHIKNSATWQQLPRAYAAVGAGFRLEYDTRDNYTAPTSGLMAQITQRFYPRFFGNASRAFASSEFSVNAYRPVWKGGVVAARLHGTFTYGSTPWGMMPTVGGTKILRGYYEGQYRDKCETDFVAELRQHVWGRSGVAVWGGLGAVYPSFKSFRGRDLLPNYGIGYRWEFKHLTNVRIDAGFGKSCWGVVLSINEAF